MVRPFDLIRPVTILIRVIVRVNIIMASDLNN